MCQPISDLKPVEERQGRHNTAEPIDDLGDQGPCRDITYEVGVRDIPVEKDDPAIRSGKASDKQSQ